MRNMPGPGDSPAWPTYSGALGDPRYMGEDEALWDAATDLLDERLSWLDDDLLYEALDSDKVETVLRGLMAKPVPGQKNTPLRDAVIEFLHAAVQQRKRDDAENAAADLAAERAASRNI